MKYRFSNFVLHTENQELTENGRPLKLSTQGYEMLLLFLDNPGNVFSKEALIEKVWKGRYVTNNSVDQCISKLRKTLHDAQTENFIETVYGKGFRLTPEVTVIREASQSQPRAEETEASGIAAEQFPPTSHARYRSAGLLAAILFIATAIIVGVVWKSDTGAASALRPKLLLVNEEANQDSLTFSPFLEQLFTYANTARIETPDAPMIPEAQKQYQEKQWRLSPDLRVVTSRLETRDGGYRLTLTISSISQPDLSRRFSGDNIGAIMKEATRWLAAQVGATDSMRNIQPLLPDDAFVLELYMRGLSALKKGTINKAAHFFSLCLQERSDFGLARLALADTKVKQGKPEEALALLDMLDELTAWPQLDVEIQSIRADILDTQGKYEHAKKLYLQTLGKYEDDPQVTLDKLRYDLSYTYTSLEEYDNALGELEKLKKNLIARDDVKQLADVYQKIGSIQQNLGQMQAAQTHATKALALFSRLEDLPGKAKVLTLLARIANHRSQYDKAANYLRQSLQISRSLDYKLGVGATLNELIYVLMVQGHFTEAAKLNLRMQDIALEIDHGAMLLASKQLAVDIARAQNHWTEAQAALDEHLALAKSKNNSRALLKNRLLSLDLYLDQKKAAPVPDIIDEVQQHIEKTRENRLRPRLQRQRARYLLLTGQTDKALTLLQAARKAATATQDVETLTEIGLILAEFHLHAQHPDQALSVLEEIEPYQPLPYPYLLLKSKALALDGKTIPALENANLCKQKANEWWLPGDERYLSNLRNPVTSSL